MELKSREPCLIIDIAICLIYTTRLWFVQYCSSVGKLPARLEAGVKWGPTLESLCSCKQHKLDLPQDPWSFIWSFSGEDNQYGDILVT